MDRFRAISAFVAVAKAGGFSAAAREAGVPLATISRQVADFEAELGVRLLQRSTRQVVLTEAGQSFYAACQRLLDNLKDAEEAVTGEYRTPKGDLTVTAPMGFGRLHLQPVVQEFLLAYPQINLRLHLVDHVANIFEEHIDVALRISRLPDSSMIARPLGHVRMVVSANPSYLSQRGTPSHPSELLGNHECIAWAALGPQNVWWFHENGVETTYPIRARLVTSSAESAVMAAQFGLGLARTTCYQAEQGVREGSLKVVMRELECEPTPVSFVYAGNRILPLKLRAFLDFASPRLSQRLESVEATLDGTSLR